MTKEELLKKIDFEKSWLYECGIFGSDVDIAFHAIKNSIIETLEQESCDDCISRQAVLDKAVYTETEEGWSGMTVDVKDIEALPPVKSQKSKTGHWEQYGNSWEDKFKCSECGKEQPKILCGERIIGHWSDYCPNCGAKMIEPQESEEEE